MQLIYLGCYVIAIFKKIHCFGYVDSFVWSLLVITGNAIVNWYPDYMTFLKKSFLFPFASFLLILVKITYKNVT